MIAPTTRLELILCRESLELLVTGSIVGSLLQSHGTCESTLLPNYDRAIVVIIVVIVIIARTMWHGLQLMDMMMVVEMMLWKDRDRNNFFIHFHLNGSETIVVVVAWSVRMVVIIIMVDNVTIAQTWSIVGRACDRCGKRWAGAWAVVVLVVMKMMLYQMDLLLLLLGMMLYENARTSCSTQTQTDVPTLQGLTLSSIDLLEDFRLQSTPSYKKKEGIHQVSMMCHVFIRIILLEVSTELSGSWKNPKKEV
jgi:hypothetical protein